MESLTDNISHLIGGYNDFIRTAASYVDSQTRSRRLVQEFRGIASLYGSSMEASGISLSADGTLSVDREKLLQTANTSDDVKQTFSYLANFSGSLLRKSNQIALNPMDYVDKKIVAYKNPGRNFASSAYVFGAENKWPKAV